MIHHKILSHEKLQEISLAWSSEEESKHPRNKSGRFAPKGSANAAGQGNSNIGKSAGAQYKRGKQRFVISEGESESDAYQRVLQSSKDKKLQKQINRLAKQEVAKAGFKEWKNQLREQQNVELVQQVREGEYEQGERDENNTSNLASTVAKEVGILAVIQSARNSAKKIFQKTTNAKNPGSSGKSGKSSQSLGTKSNPIPAEVVETHSGPYTAFKKSPSAKDQYSAFRNNAFKDVAKTTGGALATQAAINTGTQLVGASRWAAIAKPFAGVSGAAMRVGGALLNPYIAIPLTIAGAAAYFQHKKRKREALINHEKELMRRENEYGSRQSLQYKTAQDIHREAVAYATKRYARQEVEEKKRAIDEELSSDRVQSRMRKSARVTARTVADEYAKHEQRSANNLLTY